MPVSHVPLPEGRLPTRYSVETRWLHWLTALMVLVQFALGETWGFLPRGTVVRVGMIMTHTSVGVLLAATFLTRIVWAVTGGAGHTLSRPEFIRSGCASGALVAVCHAGGGNRSGLHAAMVAWAARHGVWRADQFPLCRYGRGGAAHFRAMPLLAGLGPYYGCGMPCDGRPVSRHHLPRRGVAAHAARARLSGRLGYGFVITCLITIGHPVLGSFASLLCIGFYSYVAFK